MLKERILRNFLLLSFFWSVVMIIYFYKDGSGSLLRLSFFKVESNVFNPDEYLKSQVLNNFDATIWRSSLQNENFKSVAINVIKQPISMLAQETGGIKQPMPVLAQENGALKQPIPVLAQETEGIKQPMPVLAEENGALKQPIPVLAEENGALKQPIPVLAQETEGIKQPMPVLAQETEGMNHPIPVLAQENGALKQPIPVLAQETEGIKKPMPVLALENGGMSQPIPVLAQESWGMNHPIPVINQQNKELKEILPQMVQEEHTDVSRKSKQPIQNVIFIKTHKTGSSTVTNIMQRYAKTHKLNVALPLCDHRFCYPNKFDEIFLYKHIENESYNILFNHAVFNKEKMLKIMAGPDTKIVTIIREPYSQFDSAAQYLNFRKHYNLTSNSLLLDEFFKNSDESLKNIIKSADLSQGEGAFSLAKNPNAFDFGFDVWNETPEYIENVINLINRDFHLVMIMEHMEESLVLLKNEMNWSLEDVVFNIHNARKFKDKNTDDENRSRERILNWNKLDAAIYSYFKGKFLEKIKNSPPGFDEDVKTLKEWNQSLVNHCKFSILTDLSINLIKKYDTQANLCADFLREDSDFTIWFKNMRHFKVKRLLYQKITPN